MLKSKGSQSRSDSENQVVASLTRWHSSKVIKISSCKLCLCSTDGTTWSDAYNALRICPSSPLLCLWFNEFIPPYLLDELERGWSTYQNRISCQVASMVWYNIGLWSERCQSHYWGARAGATIVLGAENVTTPDNAVLWGMHPSVGVDNDDEPPAIPKVLVMMH